MIQSITELPLSDVVGFNFFLKLTWWLTHFKKQWAKGYNRTFGDSPEVQCPSWAPCVIVSLAVLWTRTLGRVHLLLLPFFMLASCSMCRTVHVEIHVANRVQTSLLHHKINQVFLIVCVKHWKTWKGLGISLHATLKIIGPFNLIMHS